ncbi:MAG: glutaredoxin family protein [Terriglobia bacterium]
MTNIRIYSTRWCPDCRRAKYFLSLRHVQFEEINIEEVPEAEAFVRRANHGRAKVPTFEIDGRTFHCSPYDPDKLARELNLR